MRTLFTALLVLILTGGAAAQPGTLQRLSLSPASAQTCTSTGNGSAQTLTVNTAGTSYVALTQSDPDGCTLTLGESAPKDGQVLVLVNISANTATVNDSSGVQETTGGTAITLAQWAAATFIYRTDRWVQATPDGGGGGGAPTGATYITQTADGTLSAEQAMGALATGLVKSTTTTGVQSIAAAGTDYVAPGAIAASGLTTPTATILGRTTAGTGAVEGLASVPATLGGTGLTAVGADDQVLVSNGSINQPKTVPDCDAATTSKLLYDQATNVWSCGTDQDNGAAASFNQTIQEEGSGLTQRATVNFIGSTITCADNGGSSRTDCTLTGGGGSSITQGAYASLPGTCTTGDLYLLTDSVYDMARCSATNTWSFFLAGKLVTLPGTVASWTGVNVASDWTATDTTGPIEAKIDQNGSLNWRLLARAQPATPYTVTFEFALTSRASNSGTAGVYFYDGTKLMGLEVLTQAGSNTLRVQKIANVTTDGSTAAGSISNAFPTIGTNGFYWFPRLFIKLSNDGATLSFDISFDSKQWVPVFSEAIGTHLTPTHYGFGGMNISGTATDDITITMKSVVLQ